jgi:hypothetical protein
MPISPAALVPDPFVSSNTISNHPKGPPKHLSFRPSPEQSDDEWKNLLFIETTTNARRANPLYFLVPRRPNVDALKP